MRYKKFFTTGVAGALLAQPASAHCPLCTAGAAAAAGGALWLGISEISVGIFIGAFAIAIGLWFARIVKVRFPYKKTVFAAGSFLLTIMPMMPILGGIHPLTINLGGSYGSLLNRTYLLNTFLIGTLVGSLIMLVSPYISKQVSRMRDGKLIPYQGMGITFSLLLISAILFQVV